MHVGFSDLNDEVFDFIKNKTPNQLVGYSIESVDALNDMPDGIDYVGVNPIWETKTKKDAKKPIGLDGLKQIIDAMQEKNINLPIIALGGIRVNNLNSIMQFNITGAAVIGEIMDSDNPKKTAQEMSDMIKASCVFKNILNKEKVIK